MKDLTEIGANFNPIAQQKEVVIDDFAKNIINKVFDQLSVIFPAWKHAWPTDKELSAAKMEWTKAFNENEINTLEQIKHGFAKARKSESDFLPSCGKFISWCSPSPEDLGYPTEQQALRDCINYRNQKKMGIDKYARPWLIELCKRVDWWLVNSASNQTEHRKAEKHFKDEYLGLINSDYREPEETTHERLETREIVKERMSEQQLEDGRKRGLDYIKDIRKGLAKAKVNHITKHN
ncbi:MAG: putative replication protein P [Prokaryotic dsDNA virus sp.]|nr:MAG: putative replication protein P [Prokaryotic dsDNA virus sp.]|tara:strand:- start:34629 stop:35336 length:708 start_codon:yes stop_codon:yes gene_type:complete